VTRRKPVAEAERTLPHDLEAERAVLGAIILHNDAYAEATKWITEHDFMREAHRRCWCAVTRLLDRPGGSCDLLLLRAELDRTHDLEEVGGVGYVAGLVDGVPRSTNVRSYAQVVRDKSQLRGVIYAANRMLTSAYDGDVPATDVLAEADKEIVTLQHGAMDSRMASVARTPGRLLEVLEHRVANRGQLLGVNTGFQSINDLTMGWQRGDVVVIAARPSIGKTTLVLNSAVAACETALPDGRFPRGAIFSMEMKREQLELRLLSALSGVQLTSLNGGWIGDESWTAITDALGRIEKLNMNIDDAPGRTVSDIRRECRHLRSDAGLDFVVIDYVQLMRGTLERRGANRNEEITDISRRLKELAGELNVPILLLSQLNRAAEGRSDTRPKLSDLRESGALEQDADLVCFLHRRHHRESGVTNFIVEKARNGPTGTVNLTMHRETTCFTDGGEETPEQKKAAAAETAADKEHARVRAIIKHRSKKAS